MANREIDEAKLTPLQRAICHQVEENWDEGRPTEIDALAKQFGLQRDELVSILDELVALEVIGRPDRAPAPPSPGVSMPVGPVLDAMLRELGRRMKAGLQVPETGDEAVQTLLSIMGSDTVVTSIVQLVQSSGLVEKVEATLEEQGVFEAMTDDLEALLLREPNAARQLGLELDDTDWSDEELDEDEDTEPDMSNRSIN